MPNLTPQDVRNVAFNKPPFGRRGYDEEQVDAFLDAVAQTITALTDEIASLRAQSGPERPPGAESSVAAELGEIKARLTRIEAAVADGRRYATGDPLFGNPT